MMLAQHSHPERMEGQNDWVRVDGSARRTPIYLKKLKYTLAHFAGCFIGKGDRKDVVRRYPSKDKVNNAVRNHPGLSRARACKHKEWPFGREYGLFLCTV